MKPISRLMLTLAACSTLLLGVAAPVTAQTLPAERVPGLDTPVQSLTQDDLKKIAELVAGERIPVARAAELWDRMNEQQQTAVVEAIVVREGIPLEQWRSFVARERQRRPAPAGDATTQQQGWVEFIENRTIINRPSPSADIYYYYTDPGCDGDPNDTEYVFYTPFQTAADQLGRLRWTTTSSQVYYAFQGAYGGTLIGFGDHYGEVRLCIGDRGVGAAGGPQNVKNSTYVHATV